MHRLLIVVLSLLIAGNAAFAVAKPHVINFGKWTVVPLPLDNEEDNEEKETAQGKIRALVIDGRVKEFTTGLPHEVTDRLFVVRRIFRLNDLLPQENAASPRWRWQRGGWLLVDRATGHVSSLALPDFDSEYSGGTWYRDYVAYCGLSDDGKKRFAIVAQLGRRKAVLKTPLDDAGTDEPACAAPVWQRQPVRVSFAAGEGQKITYSIRGHAAGLVTEDQDQDEGEQ